MAMANAAWEGRAIRCLLAAWAAVFSLAGPAFVRAADEPPAGFDNPFEALAGEGLAGEAGDDEASKRPFDPIPEPAVFLPEDRGRDRALDRAGRLIADGRWSDAAAILDEILADERDAFADSPAVAATRMSVRAAAAEAIRGLPRPGREAYLRLSSGRAERALAEAIAADDHEAIEAVARRWFATPAGCEATLITALLAIEADRPLLAAAWLERLAREPAAMSYEPTLSVMRALALEHGGDDEAARQVLAAAARRGGSLTLADIDLTASQVADSGTAWLRQFTGQRRGGAAGADWCQYRARPDRNPVVEASPPLLVPRYRVPLVRHPEEAKRLETLRRGAVEAGRPLLPAGMPLAAGDRLVTRTPLGILAIDFASGRRIWLDSAVPRATVEAPSGDTASDALQRAFDDLTSGQLASDGHLVFAVESDPAATALRETRFRGTERRPGDWDDGNMLSAYDLADGSLRWRLPAGDAAAAPKDEGGFPRLADDVPAKPWYLGPPLVSRGDLYLLVEQRGEVRLEVRRAADAKLRWSQPLASYDPPEMISLEASWPRRLAGLTPAVTEGLLVCPVGGGCVVAVDLPLRSLRWATAYPRPDAEARINRGGGLQVARDLAPPGSEPCPIIADGRVFLAPHDAEVVFCLSLQNGTPIWSRPRERLMTVAGEVDGRLILVADDGVEAVDAATGRRLWRRPLGEGEQPSGRGILTPERIFVPCDAPGILEIAVRDGRVIARRAMRGGSLPGNLVVHRGEVISQGVDSLDVFHQEATLDSRIETALDTDPADPWAAYWRSQAAIEAGAVDEGLEGLAAAVGPGGFRVSRGTLAATLIRAMQQDFQAASAWLDRFDGAGRSKDLARVAVDGYLRAGNPARAWVFLEPLLALSPGDSSEKEPAILVDPLEPDIRIGADRWVRSRLARVSQAADEPLRQKIADRCGAIVADVLEAADPEARQRLSIMVERLGHQPAAAAARTAIVADTVGATKHWAVRGQLLALETAAPAVAAAGMLSDSKAWPLGRVNHRLHRAGRQAAADHEHLLPTPLVGAGTAGTRAAAAAIDTTRQRLLLSDACGRSITPPLPLDGFASRPLGMWVNETALVEVAVAGRAVFIRTESGLAGYDTQADPDVGRGLWRRAELGTERIPAGMARWGGGVGGRVARDSSVPLGMRIIEPDDRPRGGGRGLMAMPQGLVVPGLRSITVVDPATGDIRWERRRLPPGLDWHTDGESLVGCTVTGRDSLVLRFSDGHLRHTFDLPHRRHRLAAHGTRIAAVQPLDDQPGRLTAQRVRLQLCNPVDREVRPLGEFAGEARATATGDGRLAVLAPDGELAVLSLVDGGLLFRQQLDGAPRRFDRLQVIAWHDRYLVFAGVAAEDDEEISPLADLMFSSTANPIVSGGLWAVDRNDGQPLWPVPAVLERQSLHTCQPSDLPILTFCRPSQPGGRQRPQLSLLCLDKRTGHAVFHQEDVGLAPPTFPGRPVSGDPEKGRVFIGTPGSSSGAVELEFTGRPMPPRPPFQSHGRPPTARVDLDVNADLFAPAKPAAPALPNLFR
jgi:hypothetical protein